MAVSRGKSTGGLPSSLSCHLDARQKARSCGLDIALHAGHLPGKGDAVIRDQAIVAVQHPRRAEIGVAVHHAVAHKLRIMQRGDHRKHALLLGKAQMRLEADKVIDAALRVVAPQLDDGIGLFPRSSGLADRAA